MKLSDVRVREEFFDRPIKKDRQFFVPTRILWPAFEEFITGGPENVIAEKKEEK